ncbi:tandem-95 repeat protein [Microvirga massiliensis]|uniref:tandem-95 repeat protein n=1 Tax=Microvirga massiliensis TaxID=1033741 RepID=UPI0006603E12|nr:Ig-like domain-containing protein [Microvirga massiliensis]
MNYESVNGTTLRSIGVRVIGSDGQPITTELVDAGLPGNERFPEVVAIDDTHFAVIYCNTAGYDVQGRIYTVTGASLTAGPVVSLSDPAFPGENGYSIGVSSLPDGKIIVAWTQSSPDYTSARVIARTFDANLSPLSAEIQISQTTTPSPYRVRVDTDGNKVVVGWSQNQADTKVHALATAFEVGADGSIPGTGHSDVDISVNGNVHSITTLANGDVLVVYNGGPISGGTLDDGDRLFGKIYGPGLTGNPISFLINETVVETGTGIAEAVAFKNGGFAVYWSQLLSGNQSTGMEIYTRVYDKNYQAVTGQVQVNSPNSLVDNMVEAVVDADGNVTLVWERDISGGTPSTLIVGTTLADQDPHGKPPKLAGDYTIEVKEGLSVVLTTADFTVANAVKVPQDSVYTVSDLVHGTVLVNGVVATSFTQAQLAAGAVLFQHDGSETLTGSFRITADFSTDPNVNGATINVNVEPANDAPVVSAPSSFSLMEDTPKALTGISFSDVDAGSNLVTVTLSVPAGALAASSGSGVSVGGTASAMTLVGTIAGINAFIAGGGVSYIPVANETATIVLTVSINDGGNAGSGGALTDARTVDLNVSPVNDAPIASDDILASVPEDSGAYVIDFVSLIANDRVGPTQENDQTLTIIGVFDAVGGTVSIIGNTVVFTPDPDFNGSASFKYTVQDNGTTNEAPDPKTSTGTVSFTVDPAADTPMVANVTTAEDTLSGVIVIGRNAADGAEVTHFKITGITGGTLYLNDGVTAVTNGSFITAAEGGAGLKFMPTYDAHGTTGFGFIVQASAGTAGDRLSPATWSAVTVSEANDAPTAVDDVLPAVDEGSGVIVIEFADLLGNDVAGPANEAGQQLEIVAVSNPTGGTVAIVDGRIHFTPDAGFNGTARFEYTVRDNGTTNGSPDPRTDIGTVTYQVNPKADAPQVTPAITQEDTQSTSGLQITAAAADGAAVTYFLVTGITGGSLYLHDGVTQIADGTFITVAQATAGLKFTPAPNFTGEAGFDVQASLDAYGIGLSEKARTTVTVTEVNDAPSAQDDVLAPVAEDSGAYVIDFATLLGNDHAGANETGQTLTISAVSAAMGGTVSIEGTTVVFVPYPGYYGPASFTYTLLDNGTTNGIPDPKTSTGTVSFTVDPVNDAPTVTAPLNIPVIEDAATPLTGISFSDVDAGANPVTVTFSVPSGTLAATSGGSVTVGGIASAMTLTGTIANINAFIASSNLLFQGVPNAHGTVTATVSINDGGNSGSGGPLSDTATFDIVITPVNDAPTSADATITLSEDGSHALTPGDFPFTDALDAAPNTLAAIIIESLPGRGTFSLDGAPVTAGQEITAADLAAGKLMFTPAADEHGDGSPYSSFTFRVKDNGGTANGGQDTSGVYEMQIHVTPVNDPAVIGGTATGSVTEDLTLVASGILTVSDIDGSAQAGFQDQADIIGTYGTFSFDHITGEWSYVLDNTSAAVQALGQGEARQESFTVRSIDGTPATVVVTINGAKGADVIDGVDVDRTETTNPDGSVSQVVQIPVVTAGRTETAGSASYADIPLVTDGGRNLLAVQVGVGIGLTASGFAAPRTAGSSLTDLIREIQAHTAAGSADQAALTGGGSGFLAGLPTSGPVLVQSIVATQSGPTSGVPLVISGSSDPNASATALVIDARGLAAGTVIELQNVTFATIIGNVRVTGGAGSQVVYGDSASQHIVLGADDDTLHGGAGDDVVGSQGGRDLLFGDDGNDTIFGGEGYDRLDGGAGDDQLDGGTGVDAAHFAINFRDAAITYHADGTLTVSGAAIGTDTLTNIELLHFADRVVLADPPPAYAPGLFNEAWYLAQNPDVAAAVKAGAFTHGFEHFLRYGAQEGRAAAPGSSGWDEQVYLAHNPDVAAAVQMGSLASGFEHFLRYGAQEGRAARADGQGWDEAFYLEHNPDVAAAVKAGGLASGLEHFLRHGGPEGRPADPQALGVDEAFYLAQNPDVAAAVQAGWLSSGMDHYFTWGAQEGRDPNALFDEAWYLAHNSDVAAAVQTGWLSSGYEHFQRFGWSEGRDPSAWMDVSAYLNANADVAAAQVNPLTHYLTYGVREGRMIVAASADLWA